MANENVWKIGSRLDGYKSVLSIFRRNNIVFLDKKGDTDRFMNEVKKGDYIAIADGTIVVAVAKVVGEPKCLKDFSLRVKPYEKESIGNFEERKGYAVGVKVKILDLHEDEYIKCTRGTFFRAYNISGVVKRKYEKQDKGFKICSQTYTLSDLLNSNTHYIIPIYQRPYSWKEKQIETLLGDILNGFRDEEKIFIGTMQLSSKKYISETEYEQDVIDGQQRITTISILLKELSEHYHEKHYHENSHLEGLEFDWLETRVGEEQSRYMDDYFAGQKAECVDTNHYAANARCIREFIKEHLSQGGESNEEEVIDADKFIEYLFEDLQFVVIETRAGLSKTLQIFNTINATGLDLNASDLFKIRMYEYMKDCLHRDEEAFKEIEHFYGLIDSMNKNAGKEVFSIGKILDIYKTILIARYGLKETLHEESWNKFFENLFDDLLSVHNNSIYHSSSGAAITLDLKEMEDIAKIREEWYYNEKKGNLPKDAFFALKLLRESRYGGYWKLVFPYIYAHKNDENRFEAAYRIIVELNKLLFIYSIHYQKVVKDIRSFWHKLQSAVVLYPETEIIEIINKEKLKVEGWVKGDMRKRIVDSNRWKNLICKLSEYLRMQDADLNEIKKMLFGTRFDIEHIHAQADSSSQWNYDLLNSIGNFAMLEYDINRSIGNKPYKEKKIGYSKSKYATIKYIVGHYDDWTEQDAQQRREDEVEKMFEYLYKAVN